jgi:chaperonin GroEL
LHFGKQVILDELVKKAKHIKDKNEIKQVATLSAQDEQIGELIADVMEEIGKDGTVTVEESKNMQTDKVVVTGMQFDSGFGSPYFKTNETEAVINKPYILITDKKISSMKDILPILEGIASSGKKDVVIIADDVDGEALANLVLNKVR